MKLSLCEKVQTFNFTDSFLVLSVPDKTQPDANISPVQYFDEVTQLVLNQNISKELFKSIFFKFIFSDISKELFEIYIFKFIIENTSMHIELIRGILLSHVPPSYFSSSSSSPW